MIQFIKMEQDITKQIQERMEDLPEDVQKAIKSADLEKKIQEIGQKHKLHIDQVASLSDETLLVMLGFTSPADFPDGLMKELSVSNDQALAVAQDINDTIFMPIRESMQEYMAERALLHSLVSKETPPEPTKETATVPGSTIIGPTTPVVPSAPPPTEQIKPPPATTPPFPVKPATPPPAQTPNLHAADTVLSQPTVQKAPPPQGAAPKAPTPPPPGPYKADPYREPAE